MEVDLPVEYKASLEKLVRLQQIKEGSPHDPSTIAALEEASAEVMSHNFHKADFHTRHYVQQIIGGR